jgi:hypothetical protein
MALCYYPNWSLRSLDVQSKLALFGIVGEETFDCRPNIRIAFRKAIPTLYSVSVESNERKPRISEESWLD